MEEGQPNIGECEEGEGKNERMGREPTDEVDI
jgi:hypothetical protein